jgi:catechol 2,3-dioxygenase-like lactoylglutathione lyase family enzyme
MIGLNKVFLFVGDRTKGRDFWVQKMGFPLYRDFGDCPGQDWVEVLTPDRRGGLVIAGRPEGMPSSAGQMSHAAFWCEDLEKTRKDLEANGVVFTEEIKEESWGLSTMFQDEEGTIFNISQRKEVVTD